jgi:hypothetical protein
MTRIRMPAAGALLRARSERATAQRRYRAEAKNGNAKTGAVVQPRRATAKSTRKPLNFAPTALEIAEARARMRLAEAGADLAPGDDLTARAKRLYEGGVVPVRELALLFGIAERTLYRYVARGGWRRRHEGRGAAAARANRGRRGGSTHAASQPRGAGGRFVSRTDEGRPFARGIKALDPDGAARAATASRRAMARAKRAKASARRTRDLELGVAMLAEAVRVVRADRAGPRSQRPSAKPRPEWSSAPVPVRLAAEAAPVPLPGPAQAALPARPVATPPPAAPPESEADRRLNAIAERFEREARQRPRGPRIRGL